MSQNINPKSCNYGCNTRIYWDTSSNSYLEVFTKQKHICKNRPSNNAGNTNNRTSSFYSKKPPYQRPKMSNSFELLQGPIAEVQKKYEILSDVVTEYNGKVHGSQSHINNGNNISLVVYYEVPEGKREEMKSTLIF
jgi:hypothetical protein